METPDTLSPCILVCVIEPQSGHCFGCGRSRDEIAGWMNMDRPQKRALLANLPDRVAKLPVRQKRVTKRRRIAAARDITNGSA
ncbi:MAG: DUF1289 domain-containing protein [Hyphomicrobiales bacterium]|nr:DUF1289 domain-containing protein [Gammaproteobacteria bacterium]PCH45789.1 MAG: DUF1289 domain-containing protein [Hyphomicrobiales bacterium]